MEPKGRGGWLGFYIFQLFCTPLVIAGREASELHSAVRQGAQLEDGFLSAYITSILLCGILFFAAGHLLLTGAKRSDALNALKFTWAGSVATLVVPAFVLSSYYPLNGVIGGLVLQGSSFIFWCSVWSLYIFKSKRVKNTYVTDGGWRNEDASVIGNRGAAGGDSPVSLDRAIEESRHSQSLGFDQAAVQRNWEDSENPSKPDMSLVPAVHRLAKGSQVEVLSSEQNKQLRFTIFRADADGRWYWMLGHSEQKKVVARGAGYESRSACLDDVQLLRSSTQDALVWDKTANEFVS